MSSKYVDLQVVVFQHRQADSCIYVSHSGLQVISGKGVMYSRYIGDGNWIPFHGKLPYYIHFCPPVSKGSTLKGKNLQNLLL